MIGRRLLFVCLSSKSFARPTRALSSDAFSSNKLSRACCIFSTATSRDISSISHNSLFLSHEIHHAPVTTNNYQHRRGISTAPILQQEIRSVKTPPFAESITEGDIRWQKKVGDTVKEDEVIAEVETDKTSIPVPSPVNGTITELLFADGSKVTAGAEVCKIQVGAGGGGGGGGQKADKQQPKAEKQALQPKQEQQQERSTSKAQQQPQQPEMRQPRIEQQQDQHARDSRSEGPIPTSPPKVSPPPRGPLSSVSPQKATPARAGSGESPSSSGGGGGSRSEHRVKMTRMRLRIAERLKGAQNTAAMLTTFNEIDMSNITELRQKYKDEFTKRHNIKLGFMSAFIRASSYALMDMPVVNAVIDDQANEIVYRDYIDISVAVATPKGLVVPVLRNCENMNYAEIEQGLNAMGEKAKSNQLAIEDMDGGTFTISNGGVFGSLMGTPIINPPQSAILGMHGIFDRPVAIHGEVKIRPMMYVALTYDHRLVDGREAVTFLRKIKAAVEDPRIVLLGL